jgi:hypothetical protein
MGPEVVLVLLIAAALSGGTKTGRKASRNFIASAHKATGWRTPRSAVQHYSGKAGAAAGRATSAGARTGRQAAGKAGQHAARAAGRRWEQRIADGGTGPLIWRARPQEPGTAGNGGGGPGKNTGTATGDDRGPAREPVTVHKPRDASEALTAGALARSGPGTAGGPAGDDGYQWSRYKAGDDPWKITQTGTISADNGNLTIGGWVFTDPRIPPGTSPPVRWFNVSGSGADVLHGHSVAELHKLAHGDGCTCPVSQVTSIPPVPSAPPRSRPAPALPPAAPARTRPGPRAPPAPPRGHDRKGST